MKHLTLLLLLLLLASILTAGTYSGGDGSSGSPYQISDLADLKELVQTPADWDKEFSQTGHINANATAWWDDADDNSDGDLYNDTNDETASGNNNGFPGIGSSGTWFTGTYNGNNYTIDGIVMNRASTNNVGFFTRIQNGNVHNTDFTDLAITGANYTGGIVGEIYGTSTTVHNCSANGDVSGGNHVGGLIGFNRGGTITSCSNDVTTDGSDQYVGGVAGRSTDLSGSGGLIEACSNTSSITGTSHRVGGIVGQLSNSTAKECHNSGPISGVDEVGGVVGHIAYGGDLTTSYNTGSITSTGDRSGGLAGYNWNGSTITDCYNTGSVTGSGSNRIGGLVGVNGINASSISNCYSTGSVSGSSQAGGLVFYSSSATVSNCFWDTTASGLSTSAGGGAAESTADMKDYTTYTAVGWDFVSETTNGTDNYWDADQAGTVNDGYPIMAYQDGADTSLPVTLSYFKASSEPGEVVLEWQTSSEMENLGFILERSVSPDDRFTKVASYDTHSELEGHGSTTRQSTYVFTDIRVTPGETYFYRLSDVSYRGKRTTHPVVKVTVSVQGESVRPQDLFLEPAYPNPFNPSTNIRYTLGRDQHVRMTIYDLKGQEVTQLVDSYQVAGEYVVQWSGKCVLGHQVEAGIYILQVQAGIARQVRELTYIP